MKRKIFLIVLILVLITVGSTSCAETTEPSLPPEMLLDSDGDGFNDWFETNIAGYDPMVPNDRYIILYFRADDMPGLVPYLIDKPTEFFVKKGKVPAENIIRLSQEGADCRTLEKAINQIAERSDKNDIVFLKLGGHGGFTNIPGNYTILDEWLDRIEAMVVIVAISACGSERAIPATKEGPCPKIVYAQTGGEFIGTLGTDLRYFTRADNEYGNGDGYVSIGEVENYLTNHVPPAPKPTWGFIKGVDLSNIASQIYLTDYNPDL